jgi:hypothetical protein
MELLTRTGHLIEEQGMTYLAEANGDSALTPLQAAACTYRIARWGIKTCVMAVADAIACASSEGLDSPRPICGVGQ